MILVGLHLIPGGDGLVATLYIAVVGVTALATRADIHTTGGSR